MGIQQKAITVKWDAETTRMADELQTSFAPFVEGRSQLTRLAIKKLYADVMANGTVATMAACIQGLPCNSLSPRLEPAKVPSSLFPKMAFKTGVIQ